MAKGKSKAATGPKDSTVPGGAAPASGLSSFLLGQAPAKDDALDDIFAHSKGPSLAFQPKSKTTAQSGSTRVDAPAAAAASDADEAEDDDDDEDEDEDDEVLSELDSDAELSDENEADLEEAYAARIAAAKAKAHQATITSKKRKAPNDDEEEEEEELEDNEDSDDEDEAETEKVEDDGKMDLDDLIQGALAEDEPTAKSTKAGKKQSEDKGKKSAKLLKREQETPEERDARTVFLGNIPADCSTSRPLKKALVRHVLQNPALQSSLPEGCPPLKLDSIRFRSIAFASKVFGRKATAIGEAGGEDAGGRSRKRAKEWREAEGSDIRGVRGGFRAREDDDDAGPSRSSNGRVQPLTDAQKRKVALIRGELNDGKKACNAYLVIAALPEPVDVRAVVRAVVEAANNSVFEGFTIHADYVRPRSAAALLAAAQMAAKPNENLTDVPRNSDGFQVAPADARRTVFVGGLDFAESEENVRAAVEACLVRERGELPADERYVQNVRVVRDPSSGLGKGFCYVLLQDDSCVDELLALPPGKYLKISRRKVRLERCKTAAAAARAKASARTVAGLPPRSAAAAGNGSNAPGAAGSRPRPVRLAAPQDPTAAKHHHNPPSKAAHQAKLAEALAKLPPSERKAVKSLDAERIARRAQKKEQKRLAERYERKQANLSKKTGGGGAEAILGKESRAAERHRKEKKRIVKQSKSSVKKKK